MLFRGASLKCQRVNTLEQLSISNAQQLVGYVQAPWLLGGTTLVKVLLHLPGVPRGTEHQLQQ